MAGTTPWKRPAPVPHRGRPRYIVVGDDAAPREAARFLHGELRTTGTGFEQTHGRGATRIAEVGDRATAASEPSPGPGVQFVSSSGASPGNEVKEPVLIVPPAGPGPNAGPRVPSSIVGPPKPLI
jgi:hypothetical protein